ncbi:hypothetical protein ACPPVU_02320 [Mucilaginibacter sp. McL0603]|uniref:hypothetical protein n=1 Tax=Mucilaginibacter sp. McL0603 TaxID=3415670 RepID=UPI003CEACFED
MKPTFLFIALFFSISCYSQTLELHLSLPQPRLGQSFYLSFSSDTISKQIFNLAPGKFKINSYIALTGQETSFSVQIEALKVGPNEIGPLTFNFNGNTYKTDIIKFIVADSLPNVNKGIWIRKVPIDDTTVYIMIDQRIPTHNRITQKDSNTISMSAEVNDDEKEAGLKSEDIENAKIENWGSSSETSPDFTGKGLSHASFYKCYKVTIIDKSKPLVLVKQTFNNLPDYYKFKNITIN